MSLLILLVLVALLVGVFPAYPYSAGWGYGPVGGVGLLVVVLVILLLSGRL